MNGAVPGEAPYRPCDVPGCPNEGNYPAPKSRTNLNEHYWFCMDHVRAYNANWNYFAGMSTAEMEAQIRSATTWERPTWNLGSKANGTKPGMEEKLREYVHGAFRFGEDAGSGVNREESHDGREKGTGNGYANSHGQYKRRFDENRAEVKALAVLDLSAPVDFPTIKSRYKELVKRHHPDANGGDPAAEERLKVINEAYTTLKTAFASIGGTA